MSTVTDSSFTVSHDSASKVVTGTVFFLLLAIATAVHSILAGGLIALLLVVTYAWSPSGYGISGGDVVVRRLAGDARIRMSGIREVRIATPDDFRGCIRLFGSGGMFGYYGIFRTSKLGKSRWYVTNRSRSVVIVGESGTVVLSPDDVEGFIAAVRTASPKAAAAAPGSAMFGTMAG